MSEMKFALYMQIGKKKIRKVTIGHFPSKYRCVIVYTNLGWSSRWTPLIEPLTKEKVK